MENKNENKILFGEDRLLYDISLNLLQDLFGEELSLVKTSDQLIFGEHFYFVKTCGKILYGENL